MSEKKQVRPWDIFNKNIVKVMPEIQEKRLNICKECPSFFKPTSQCIECGCRMSIKTKLPDSSCPLGKWNSVAIEIDEEI
jgi:hypothetical protein